MTTVLSALKILFREILIKQNILKFNICVLKLSSSIKNIIFKFQ